MANKNVIIKWKGQKNLTVTFNNIELGNRILTQTLGQNSLIQNGTIAKKEISVQESGNVMNRSDFSSAQCAETDLQSKRPVQNAATHITVRKKEI